MNGRPLFALPLTAVCLLGTVLTAHADRNVPGQIVVKVRRGVKPKRLVRSYPGTVVSQMAAAGSTLYLFQTPLDTYQQTFNRMQQDPGIVSAISNPIDSNPEDEVQWTTGFDGGEGRPIYAGQRAIGQVNFNQAARYSDGSGVTVAILDTGISRRHAALAGQTLPGWNFIDGSANTDDAPSGSDTDADGVRDEAVGHGTMIAGLVNRFAPRARLLPVKVLTSDGHGTLWSTAMGVRYAIKRGAKIINLSWGTPEGAGILQEALQEARDRGILVITTAGNRNEDVDQFPADFSFTLTVTSLDDENRKAPFANWGSRVDVAAPGVNLVSTYWDGGYVEWSGTSFSAGIVSGLAALIRSRRPDLRLDDVEDIIIETGRSVDAENPEFDGKLGDEGLVDFDAAIVRALTERGRGGRGGRGRGGDD